MTFGFVCYIIPFVAHWDIAKLVRHRILIPTFRRFESCYPSQTWRQAFWFAVFFYQKTRLHFAASAPLPKKGSLTLPPFFGMFYISKSKFDCFFVFVCSTSVYLKLFDTFIFAQTLLLQFHKFNTIKA